MVNHSVINCGLTPTIRSVGYLKGIFLSILSLSVPNNVGGGGGGEGGAVGLGL